MTLDALCDMPVDVVKFLNYVGGERDVEQGCEEIEFTDYADLMDKIKYENVVAAYILFKNTSSSEPVLLSKDNFASVAANATLYAYFNILQPITKKKAFVVRSVSYESGPRHTDNDIVIHHSNYADLLQKLKFNVLEPTTTYIVNRRYQVVELSEHNYNEIVSGDEICTHFHMKGSRQCGSRFEELSRIDARLAGIHINL
jgi:sulfur carrier protein ThiS